MTDSGGSGDPRPGVGKRAIARLAGGGVSGRPYHDQHRDAEREQHSRATTGGARTLNGCSCS